jgi:copper chaperone CopZ
MNRLSLDVPSMYGDHHVMEVRRILLELPGVTQVYASSAFHTVEIEFDQKIITKAAINAALEPTGYLESMASATESGRVTDIQASRTFIRHTTTIAQSGQAVTFTQQVNSANGRIWNCPGMGVPTKDREA